jgi:mono/diheme cytochrome c family protein
LCTICHASSSVTTPPSALPQASNIPHSIVGLSNCLSCHSQSGERPFPSDHIGRTNAQCTICHRPSSTTTTPPATTRPAAPSGLAGTPASSTQVNLAWVDNSNNETGFKVERASNSNFTTGLMTFSIAAGLRAYSDTGLTASTTYYYRVLATNAAGDSSPSNSVSVTTAPPAITRPAAPTGLSGTAASGTQINLTWIDNSNNETGFKVQRAVNSSFTTGLMTFTIPAGLGAYADTGLTANTTYYYRVLATNAAGDSAPSNSISVTTQSQTLSGQAIYNANCLGCHGLATATRTNMTQAQLIAWIPRHNTGRNLTPDQVTAVAIYIKP